MASFHSKKAEGVRGNNADRRGNGASRRGSRGIVRDTQPGDDGFVLPGELSTYGKHRATSSTHNDKESLEAILTDLLGDEPEAPQSDDDDASDAMAVLEAALESVSGDSKNVLASAAPTKDSGKATMEPPAVSLPPAPKLQAPEPQAPVLIGLPTTGGTAHPPHPVLNEMTGGGAVGDAIGGAVGDAIDDAVGSEAYSFGDLDEAEREYLASLGEEAYPEGAARADAPRFIIEPPPRKSVWPMFITAIVIFLIVAGGLTYVNRTIIARQAEERAVIQQEADRLLEESLSLIQEADKVIVPLDQAIESQVTEEGIPQLEALLDQRESTLASLDRAIETAARAQEAFIDEDRKALAQHAQDAAGYRKELLDMSSKLTGYDIAAMRSALALEYAWTLIVNADSDMRAAVETVNTGGADAVEESRDYNQSAFDKLGMAGEALVKATEEFPGVDVSALTAYVVAKRESAQLALESDQAFLDGDRWTATLKNDEFLAKDAEVVELAAAIPTDPLSLIVVVYDEATSQLHEEYRLLWSQAADGDAYLRDYLDVTIQ